LKEQIPDRPGVIAPPPFIYLSGLLIGAGLQRQLPVPWLPRPLRNFLGSTLLGSAIFIIALAFRNMKHAGTNVNPTQPTTTLVTTGPYLFSRNPLYLGLTMLYTGLALLGNLFWAVLLLPVILRIINQGVIAREERYLENKFGEQYRQYKERVPRWF
jgi:protein-S-isoprenylcysteine O-methyltransferase Ste14